MQNKNPKMAMSNLPELLHITEMTDQAPSVRDYSTKGELTQLILLKVGIVLSIPNLLPKNLREKEKVLGRVFSNVMHQYHKNYFKVLTVIKW